MSNEYDRPEWEDMTREKAFGLMMELDDWKNAREEGGYDIRLLLGAIEVCKVYIKGKAE